MSHEQHPAPHDPAPHDPGLHESAVSGWMRRNVADVSGDVTFARIAGGRSNLTYRATDGSGNQWVLRRAPLGMGDSRSHDVLREASVLQRLSGAAVPVPQVAATCGDSTVTGAPFYVMDFIDGIIVRDPASAEELVSVDRRADFAKSLVATLARLHSIDPREVGWAELADRRDYIPRQLARWSKNWAADRVRVLEDIGRAHDRLLERVPAQGAAGIVHGDFRIDNCVFAPDGQVRAVLDWELTTVGDTLADLGQLLMYWAEPGDAVRALEQPPTLTPGFPTRDALVETYLAAAPAGAVHDLEFYVAYNWWKVACIVENVYTRMARGAMGASDRTPESFARQAERLAAEAWRHARRL